MQVGGGVPSDQTLHLPGLWPLVPQCIPFLLRDTRATFERVDWAPDRRLSTVACSVHSVSTTMDIEPFRSLSNREALVLAAPSHFSFFVSRLFLLLCVLRLSNQCSSALSLIPFIACFYCAQTYLSWSTFHSSSRSFLIDHRDRHYVL